METLIRKEQSRQMNAITCCIHDNFKHYYGSFLKNHTKPGLNNMVLVAIDSFKGSLQTASRPSKICTATFLFFNLPYVCNHNSDKS